MCIRIRVVSLIVYGLLFVPLSNGQFQPPYYNPSDENALTVAKSRVESLIKNDELGCLPRLLCEYAAGGTPGQGRAVNVDIKSLFTLLQYLGLDQSSNASPMFSLAKAVTLGYSRRGDSYECYRNYPLCPRDQGRLLYYLNNHRGGFFRGFGGYYHRNTDGNSRTTNPVEGESRIVNNKFADNVASINFPPYSPEPIYSTANDFYEKPEFVFSNDHRSGKAVGLPLTDVSDRLPNRLSFPTAQDIVTSNGFVSNNDIGSSFFPLA